MEVPGCRVGTAAELDDGSLLSAKRRRRGGCCPGCGRPSRAGRGRCRRRAVDLRSLGRPVRLDLEVRRLRCVDAACPRRSFGPAGPRPRDPQGPADASSARGAAAGSGSPPAPRRARGSRGRGPMPASASAVLRRLRAAPMPRVGTPRAIGTGGWAWRKGRSCATLVVGLAGRSPGCSCSPWRRCPGARPPRSSASGRTPMLRGQPLSHGASPPSRAAARVQSKERRPGPRGALETWPAEARSRGTAVIETFATGIEHDGAAARAALTTPWRDGPAEGPITRPKLVRRQACGRAGFAPPRRRVLQAPRSTRNDEKPPSPGSDGGARPAAQAPRRGGRRGHRPAACPSLSCPSRAPARWCRPGAGATSP